MKNLLQPTCSTNDVQAILTRHPLQSPLPVIGSEAWLRVRTNPVLAPILNGLICRATEEREMPQPELTDELYADFMATGVRLRFETVYFERRRRLARASVALLMEGGSEWERSFLEKLETIFAEESWALPAHVSQASGKDPRMIDLFAAETANLMAECLVVFDPIIPAPLQSRIRERLRRDVFENYRDNSESFFWTKVTNNWNAVCHQGVLGAALQVEDDAKFLTEMLVTAGRHLPNFLSGYGPDGGCTEGPTYWEYGFGWFTILNEQLESRSGGELSLFANDDKIVAIAQYGTRVSLAAKKQVNFADAAPERILRPYLFDYLGTRLDLSACQSQALENYRQLVAPDFNCDGERADLLDWFRTLLHCPAELAPSDALEAKGDAYFPNLAVWVVRGLDAAGNWWEVAAKGGHNDEHHNHNDLGSFIVNINGIRFITEIGAPEYTRPYFGAATRYDFLATRTQGHSLPVLNHREQAAGSEFAARITRAEICSDTVCFEADLTKAYPQEARCRSMIRTLEFKKSAGQLTLTDVLALDEPGLVECGLITEGAIVEIMSPRLAHVRKDGVTLALACGESSEWNRIESHSYFSREGTEEKVERLVLTPRPANGAAANLVVTFAIAAKSPK